MFGEEVTPIWISCKKVRDEGKKKKGLALASFKRVVQSSLQKAGIDSSPGHLRHAGISMAMAAEAPTAMIRNHTLHMSDDMIAKHYYKHVDRLGPKPKARCDAMSFYLRAGYESRVQYLKNSESSSNSDESDEEV